MTGENAGDVTSQACLQVENITGGSGKDIFLVADGGSITGAIGGGAGDDTLIGPDTANNWSLTGPNTGTLGVSDFTGTENLTGGNANDAFRVVGLTAALTGLLDGGEFDIEAPTINSLDYSARGGAVSVDLKVGAAPGLTLGFERITSVVGSNLAGDTLVGPAAALDHTTWNVTGPNSGTVDGTTFAKFENLTGQDALRMPILLLRVVRSHCGRHRALDGRRRCGPEFDGVSASSANASGNAVRRQLQRHRSLHPGWRHSKHRIIMGAIRPICCSRPVPPTMVVTPITCSTICINSFPLT